MQSNAERMAVLIELRSGQTITPNGLLDMASNVADASASEVDVRVGFNEAQTLSEAAQRLNPRLTLAIVEFTATGNDARAILMALTAKAGAVFAPIAERAASNIAIGPLHVVDFREGDAMAMVCGRRKGHMSADQFFDWWLHHHVPVGQQLCGGRLPFSAEMVHVDRDSSRLACAAAEFGWQPLDNYEALVADHAALDAFFSDARIQHGLGEDEATGGIEPGSLTSAVLNITRRPPR